MTLSTLAEAGVHASRLLGTDLHRPSRGIRVPKSCHHPDLAALARSRTELHKDSFAVLVSKARIALELLRVGVDSPPETKLRLLLEGAGLPEFTPNCRVDDVFRRPVWTDLGCERFRTCIEYDGLHHLAPEQQASDAYGEGWQR